MQRRSRQNDTAQSRWFKIQNKFLTGDKEKTEVPKKDRQQCTPQNTLYWGQMTFPAYFLDDSASPPSLSTKCNRKYKAGGHSLLFREILLTIIHPVWGLHEIPWEDNGQLVKKHAIEILITVLTLKHFSI